MTTTTQPPPTKKRWTSTSLANTNRQPTQRCSQVQATSAAFGESQEDASALTTMDIPMIFAKVFCQTSVLETEEIRDHEPVDQGNQSLFGTSTGQYGVVLTSSYV